MMDAPISIISERMGEGVDDLGGISRTERARACHAARLSNTARTYKEHMMLLV
jgi:hypothetical protein